MAFVPIGPSPRFGRKLVLPGIPRINYDHPNPAVRGLTRSLAFCWVAGVPYDLVSGTPATYTANATVAGQYGYGTTIGATSGITFAPGRALITSSSPSDGLGDLTMMVLANPASAATSSRGFYQSNNNQLFTTPECGISFNSSNSGVTAGNCEGTIYNGSLATDVTFNNGTEADGNYHVFGIISTNGGFVSGWTLPNNFRTFYDGVNDSSVVGRDESNTQIDCRNNFIGIGSYGTGTDNLATGTNFITAAAWNRALTDSEAFLYYQDPLAFVIWPSDSAWVALNSIIAGVSLPTGNWTMLL